MKYKETFYTTKFGYSWYWAIKHGIIACRFRYDPVPSTGCKRNRSCGHRKMRTTQERRESLYYPEYHRARRNFRNLPEAWDDYMRNDWYDRSWKRCTKKRKQWMK